LLLALTVVAGCRGDGAAAPAASPDSTTAPVDPCGLAATPPATYDHVVMLVNENRTWTGGRSPAVGVGFSGGEMPYLARLATECAYYVDWAETDAGENSLNQYIGLTAGVVDPSIGDDCNPSDGCRSIDDNIFRQIRESGGTPRTFVDAATEPCSVGNNRAKHIPALYFQGGDDPAHCADEVRPLSEFDPRNLPTFAFVVPDQCNDGHDCGDDVVDAFARSIIEPVLDSASYRAGRTLVVVIYDEDRPVPNLIIAPTAHAGPITDVVGSHASLLKTVEVTLGLPVLDQGNLPAAVDLRPPAHV